MPAELFRAVVAARRRPGARLSAMPVSLTVHAVVLVTAIVIPLIASTALPPPPVQLTVKLASMPVVPVPAVPRPPTTGSTLVRSAAPAAPVVAPSSIGEETLAQPPSAFAERTDPGIDIVTGVPGAVVALPEPPPPPPKPVAPLRVGGEVSPPRKVFSQAPVYPSSAIFARIEGTVVIEAVISTSGLVRDARVVTSVPLLDQAALDAVRQWRFTPTLLNGIPVEVVMTVRVDFKLTR